MLYEQKSHFCSCQSPHLPLMHYPSQRRGRIPSASRSRKAQKSTSVCSSCAAETLWQFIGLACSWIWSLHITCFCRGPFEEDFNFGGCLMNLRYYDGVATASLIYRDKASQRSAGKESCSVRLASIMICNKKQGSSGFIPHPRNEFHTSKEQFMEC